MAKNKNYLLEKLKKYHFELKHLLVLFLVLILFLVIISWIHQSSVQELLDETQDWFQQDSAERLASLVTTSLELLMENTSSKPLENDEEEIQNVIQAFNVILTQQKLHQNVEDVCLLVADGDDICVIDDGKTLYTYFFGDSVSTPPAEEKYATVVELYRKELQEKMRKNEHVYSVPAVTQGFHVFVPFVPKGEYVGVVYLKNVTDFTFLSDEVIANYYLTVLIFATLITLGLLSMLFISINTVRERDAAQLQLFREREKYLLEKIDHKKEALFTKRIYHTHHKAEKVMGFIKEDLHNLTRENITETRYRVSRYANFIARVIYDMKWYDPPLNIIRNPMYRTDINEVIRFVVQHIFLRLSNNVTYQFKMELDEKLPCVAINEFVVWEILEPLIQNCLEHSRDQELVVRIQTQYFPGEGRSNIRISDNGVGIDPALLVENRQGIKKIFLENSSTKENGRQAGYGCYIAHEIAQRRCGWGLNVENLPEGGCQYIIHIPRNEYSTVKQGEG